MRQLMRLVLLLMAIMTLENTSSVNAADAAGVGDAPNAGDASGSWQIATPQSEGLDANKLDAMWRDLKEHQTTALLILRHDKVVFEQYADGYTRTKPHSTASLAKALVGGMSLMVAMNDGRIKADDPVSKYVPQWSNDPRKRSITIRHLATHTSGLEDAEAPAEDVPHDRLTGWKGDFWKYLAPPQDPFTLARDSAPVLDPPGTAARYSNPGMAMLGYCITTSLHGAPASDLRSLLRHRIMEPLGVPEREWSCGYNTTTKLDDKPLVATWGGGSYSANAVAHIGQLLLHDGAWRGRQLLAPALVHTATRYAGMPNHAGLGWWVNQNPDGSRFWKAAPDDAFWGAGAGQQLLLVIPSYHLVVVRSGRQMDQASFDGGIEQHIINPLMQALTDSAPSAAPGAAPAAAPHAATLGANVPSRDEPAAPYPPSPRLAGITWAPANTIIRRAVGSDNWPLTWGDDDNLYTAYGDGTGFATDAVRLSLGLARISGQPPGFTGANLPARLGATPGDGARGQKASGLLMVQGILYLLARNAGNAQLAWSTDHGQTWHWCPWKFTTSFGYPVFLNFGRNYQGARDAYVYIYSPDSASAYAPADSMVLARVPQDRLTERAAYEFLAHFDAHGQPVWTQDINARGPVFSYPGHCLRSQVSYNAAIGRYLWWQQRPQPAGAKDRADTRDTGGFGIYDAPTPWGPWTTVYFTPQWDVGPGENASFPTKWMSADGQTLYLVFSGEDSFSVRQATLQLAPAQP